MWDLGSIVAQNNLAAVQAMMTADRVQVADNPAPAVWPLMYLAERLKVGPPVVSEIVNGFIDIEWMERFLGLIRAFLPEHAEDILSRPTNQRAWRFCRIFDRKYFPLGVTNPGFGTHELLYKLPVQLMGMSYEAYHELNLRPGYLMLMSLVPYPFEGDERDLEDDEVPFDISDISSKKSKWVPRQSDVAWLRNLVTQLADGGSWIAPMGFKIVKHDNMHLELQASVNSADCKEVIRRTLLIAKRLGIEMKVNSGRSAREKRQSGARIVLLEAAGKLVGLPLVKQIPADGWDNKELHIMTARSHYAGVGEFADWALSETGLLLLDHNYEHCEYKEGEMEPLFQWTEANVRELAKQWPAVKKVRRKIEHIVEWLEAAPEQNFRELLEFLLKKAAKLPKRPKRPPYDPMAHWCGLDVTVESEDEEQSGDQTIEHEIALGNT